MHKIYLFLLFSTLTYAQSVNFDKVLEQTLKNSKDLKQQELNFDSSKLDSKMIDSINYGKLSITEEISRTNHAGYVFNSKLSSREATFNDFGAGQFQGSNSLNVQPDNLNYPDARNNFNTKLIYEIPLFTGFKLSNQKDILKLQEKANEIKYNLDKKELSLEVLKAYNSAVVAKDFTKALEKAKIAIMQISKSALAFHKEGLTTKIDVNEAKVYELNINSQLIEASNNFQLALAYLRFLSSDDSISDVEALENISFEIPQENLLYTQALESRDEIKIQDIQINASKKNIDIANSAYYPSVYSHLEYGFNDDTLTLDDDKDYYMALVGVNLTLFDNTRNIEKQKSKIEYAKASLNKEKLKDAIKLELKKTTLNLETKEKILKEKMEAKNLANEVLEQSKLLYQNHLISMTTLLSQEANYRKQEALLIEARYEKSLALAKINLALGKNINKENKQ
ncbi:RND family efflux system, outer membrane channel protein, TolC family [Arcobacter venerupis]|uniref:RND family efflux system, outer membrane channel protein, TolC family n=1 Tax=Arcobacter venerupis TaxID=1054033 RepID=A0AAE7BA60_9BACT|nr:TolC family protein [Arcobacter venerupis]QKF67386.1 RND family efflux system, outer membrane channel protein, TolC family [Arcobacter venerupis]RWS50599.1 transporter [Arcobacter venerupis]